MAVLLREYPIDENTGDVSPESGETSGNELSPLVEEKVIALDKEIEQRHNASGFHPLKYIDYHLILWSSVVNMAGSTLIISNLTIFAKSGNLEKYSTFLTTFAALINTLGRILIGILSDALLHKLPRMSYLVICNAFRTILLFPCMAYSNSIILLSFNAFSSGLAYGLNSFMTALLIFEEFGKKHFGWNYGWALFIGAMFTFASQALFGKLYEDAIEDPEDKDCYGTKCFVWIFLLNGLLGIIGTILNIIFCVRKIRNH